MTSSFCQGEQIVDLNQLWHGNYPIFNRCFQRTLPIYLPALFLWLLAPFYIYRTLKQPPGHQTLPYNLYNISRLLFTLAIVAVNGVQLLYDLWFFAYPHVWYQPSLANLTASIVNVFTFTLLFFLFYLHRLEGQHTSALAWLFTFFSTLFALPSVYMHVFFYGNPDVLAEAYQTGTRNSWNSLEMALFAVHFGLLLIVFLLTCFADVKPQPLPGRRRNRESQQEPLMSGRRESNIPLEECPEQYASFLSFFTYWWFNRLAMTGFKRSLTLSDLWRLKPEFTTATIAPLFDRAWARQIKYSPEVVAQYTKTEASNGTAVEHHQILPTRKDSKPGTVRALMGTFGWSFACGAFYKLISDLLMFVNPQLLKLLITFISTPSSPFWHGLVLASLFFLTATFQSILLNHYFHIMYSIGMHVRTALTSAIYRKSLTLSNVARADTTSGEIQNLMSVDIQKFVNLIPQVNRIWSSPLQIGLTVYFLWAELGPSVLAGMAVLLLVIPLNGWIGSIQRRMQMKQMAAKDERVKVINEVLNGMKVIKLMGWEVPFIGQILAIRDREIVQLQKILFVNAFTSIIWCCSPFIVSFVTFAVFVLSSPDNVLDAKRAFVSLSLFELLRFPLTMLPELITSTVMASVSVKRVDQFLNAEQLQKYVTREEASEAIKLENGFFAWSASKTDEEKKNGDVENEEEQLVGSGGQAKMVLTGIDLKIPRGSLVAVVGHVGAGKSSLLSAILGDMERVEGSVNVARGESVAYVAQQAWIRNATLRENVLFGAAYEKKRYEAIIEMCALKPDLAILPGGDQTEIGEKGINLSGGQKQRVALARACYQASSIVLLDDPLAAVDSHVARHIFTQVLHSTTGYLRDRTRVLVTNNIAILPEVDQIVVLTNGSISEMGTYDQLITNSGKFADFIKEHANEKDESDDIVEDDMADGEVDAARRRTRTISSASSAATSARASTLKSAAAAVDDRLIESERTETGTVKWAVYLDYFRSMTCLWIGLFVFGYAGMQLASVGSNIWLAVWSSDVKATGENQTDVDTGLRNYRLAVYGGIGLVQSIVFFIGAITLVKGTINSSVTLHRSLLERIMRSPMKFFDTTPLGRIVNRFSKDIDTIDTTIPITLETWFLCFLQVVATFVLITIQVPVFITVVVPILLFYLFIQKFYVATSRQLKRLESVTRSPIFSHFGETLAGVNTIRAFNATHRFVAESNDRVDTNQRCIYPSVIANRWLSLRLEFSANMIILFTALFSVWSRESFAQQPGFIGLIITYALSITGVLNWTVRMVSEMETNIVSVERIGEYCKVESERQWTRSVNADPMISPNWPEKGEVVFENYSVRYRDGLSLVLNGISFTVAPSEKVGLVGRTGAGKSSLTLALFRILEAAQGRILIDGVDISKIGLHELRSKLSIIPQDPVLFSGTIRSNLDPFNCYTDNQLWTALEHCHLKDYITANEAGLDLVVAENGSNLSVGQRQLLCLGRALLQRARILVMDEATGSIDLETDSLIQQTIRKEFAQCTVLTIAHRLHTIIDSDRVMVLDGGQVVEFDSPASLLANHQSQFYSLAKDAGIV